jgi:glucose-1-phosphate thymidylyltransferase
MKAVVLMAGKGTRMAKYYEGPKQLLPVKGKPVVEHMLDQLPAEITEYVFVVGGPHEPKVREYFKSGEYKGKPITFVVQTEQLGLAHAFKTAQDHVQGRWMGMVGDDIFGPNGLAQLAQCELGVLAYRVPNPESFGVLVTDADGYLVRAVEKPKEFISDLVWTGAMVMDESFFTMEVAASARGEYETPDVWTKLINEAGKKIKVVESEFWLPVNDKPQLEEAERVLAAQ